MERLGFVAFEKLKYYARFKVAEASIIKRPRSQSNLNNIENRGVPKRKVDVNNGL